MNILKQSTAVTIVMGPMLDSADGNTPETTLTISQADIRLSKNGGAYAQTNNAAGATHMEVGKFSVPLDTTDTATLGKLRVDIHESGALAVWREFTVVPADVYNSLVLGTDTLHADVTQWLGTAAAAPSVAGVPEVDITHLLGTAWLAPGVAGTPDVNAKLLGGTAQTGRDVGSSVLLSTGTGTGQLDFTSGIVKSNLTQILSHLITQTGTQIADGFEHFFNVGTPTGTVNSLPGAPADAAGGLPISDSGSLDIDAKLAHTHEITTARMGALTDWINGGRLDNLLDAIPTTAMRGTDNATLAATWTDARAGYLDNISVGAVALASGVDLTSIHGVALTETIDGYLAAAFVKLFDVATPLLVASDVMRGTDGANTTVPDAAGIAPTAAEIKTAIEAAGSHLALILADTEELQTDWENGGRLDLLIDAILTDTSTTLDGKLDTILGLNQENFYIDSTAFTGANMTSCRIRIYSVAGSVGTASDVISTYTITATYAGDNLASYKAVKS